MNNDNDIIIREEIESDFYESECCIRDSFWNLYMMGANEHFLVHRLRSSSDYIPELSKIATTKDGKIIGAIYYSKSIIVTDSGVIDVISFGPLCVHPDYQKKGIGKRLLLETIELAKVKGYTAIFITGIPSYYSKFGFQTCDKFNITTQDGKNFDAFMCYELQPSALKNIKGYFQFSEVFNNCSQKEVDEFDKKYPPKIKEKKPTQLKDNT